MRHTTYTIPPPTYTHGLHWEYKPDSMWQHSHSYRIHSIPRQSIYTSPDSITHQLYQADNLLCLHHLLNTKVNIDMIYIDPPYNTGNKKNQEGFVYHDKRKGTTFTYAHSDWLNFMYPRLYLAKQLLAKHGLIFISIDENEFAHLKLLCDMIFGESQFMNFMVWKKRGTGGQVKDGSIISQTEFILIYAKNKKFAKLNKIPNQEVGKVKWRDFRKSGGQWQREYRPKQFFPIYYNPKDQSLSLEPSSKLDLKILPQNAKGEDGFWENGVETTLQRLKAGELKAKLTKSNQLKVYQKEVAKEGMNAGNLIDIPSVQGSHEIKQFDLQFNNVKPLSLLQYLLQIGSNSDATILDFFAGSGSTAHAVFKLNDSTSTRRKIITCNNNESNIFQHITLPRIQRAINGYVNSNGKKIDPLPNVNLDVFSIEN